MKGRKARTNYLAIDYLNLGPNERAKVIARILGVTPRPDETKHWLALIGINLP